MIGDEEPMESYRVGTVVALNPTYGVSYLGSDKASETSGSNDYLSISVNPTYQFIDQSRSRSQTVLSDSSLDEQNGGISIPGATKRTRAAFTNPNSPNLLCNTNTSFLSNSAPPVSYRNMPLERSSSSISSDGGEQNQSPSQSTGNSPYSYARHSTGRGRTTSNGSAHPAKRTQPHFKIDEECEEIDSGKGSSSAASTIGSNRARNYLTPVTNRQNESYSLPNSSLYQKSYSCEDDILKFDIILCMFASLTIIISIVAIALCIVVKTKGIQVTNTDGTPTKIVLIGGTIPPTTVTINKTTSCNCTIGRHDNFTLPGSLLQKLKQIKSELANLKSQKPDILNKSRNLLHNLLSQIKAINNSIEKIKPLINQPQSPHLTGINLPSSFSINIIDRCTITESNTATVNPPLSDVIVASFYPPGTLPIINNEGIVVDFVCQTFHASNLPMNTSTSIVTRTLTGETISNPNDIVEVFKKSYFICQCFNFGTSSVECRYFATRCPFEYGSVNTTLHT